MESDIAFVRTPRYHVSGPVEEGQYLRIADDPDYGGRTYVRLVAYENSSPAAWNQVGAGYCHTFLDGRLAGRWPGWTGTDEPPEVNCARVVAPPDRPEGLFAVASGAWDPETESRHFDCLVPRFRPSRQYLCSIMLCGYPFVLVGNDNYPWVCTYNDLTDSGKDLYDRVAAGYPTARTEILTWTA